MQKLIRQWSLVGSITLISLLFGNAARGQISPDGTLPTSVDLSGNVFEITGGATEGSNLFHSFGEFSVPTGFEAFFNNGTIDNIISRVTGGSISNIDGLIRANDSANLILINPAGISFGSGASLDIGGAFMGSTANSISFEDGTVFSADPNQAPLLTVTAPIGVAFATNPGNIQSQGANLTLESGNTFALVGGNVNLDNTKITAPSGNIEIGSVGGDESVSLTAIPQGWQLGFEGVSNFQDIQITSGSELASTLRSGERLNFTYSDVGGDIKIRGRDITIAQGAEATLPTIFTRGQSQAGNITIEGQNVIIAEGSQQFDDFEFFNPVDTIDADSLSNQSSGTITIDGEQITIDNSVGITSELWNQPENIQPTSDSNSEPGSILIGTITSGNRILINGSDNLAEGVADTQIITDTHGFHENGQTPGTANDIVIGNINTQEVLLEGGSEINAESHPHSVFLERGGGPRDDFNAGNAGSIDIRGQQVGINGENTRVTASTFGTGEGGNISIEGINITINQGEIVAETAGASSDAQGGSISIGRNETNSEVTIENNATVSVRTGETLATSHGDPLAFGNAPAGDISIGNSNSTLDIFNASEISASTIFAEGFINPRTDDLAGPGTGDAGRIEIDANEFNLIQNAIVESETFTFGNAGDIFLRIGSLLKIENGSQINVTTESQGQAGNIDIVTDTLFLNNEAIISSDTQTGDEGNIIIQSRQAILQNNSEIITDSTQTSDGGNITFTSSDSIALIGNSDITADAETGQGGVITIDTQGVFQCGDCEITALGGVEGIVDINTPEAQNSLEFLDIPQQVVGSEEVVVNACGVDKGKQESQFTITGRGGLPPRPTSSLTKESLIGFDAEDEIDPNADNSTGAIKDSATEELPSAARGWYLNPQGKLVLAASVPGGSPYNSGANNPDCDSISHDQ